MNKKLRNEEKHTHDYMNNPAYNYDWCYMSFGAVDTIISGTFEYNNNFPELAKSNSFLADGIFVVSEVELCGETYYDCEEIIEKITITTPRKFEASVKYESKEFLGVLTVKQFTCIDKETDNFRLIADFQVEFTYIDDEQKPVNDFKLEDYIKENTGDDLDGNIGKLSSFFNLEDR